MDGVMNSIQSIHFFHEFMRQPQNWFQKYMPADMEDFNHYEDEICPMAVSNMATLIKQHPDTRFVISSTWRLGRDEAWFEKLFRHIGMIGDRDCFRCDGKGHYSDGKECTYCDDGVWKDPNNDTQMVIGRTPRLNADRGDEIQKWLDDHPEIVKDVTEFVILDDDGDMTHFIGTPQFIQTDGKVGFDYRTMEKVDQLFDGFNTTVSQAKPNTPYRLFDKPRDTIYFYDDIKDVWYYFDKNDEKRSGVYTYPSCLISEVKNEPKNSES